MPDYDFKQLSPYDFEQLCRDLLQAEDGIRLESFKTGRDGGIDFRFARGLDKEIVQCKHYATTGLNGLIRDIKKEALKAIALKPTRYVLVTSVPLSPANNQTIQALFGDILEPADIIGCDDLNNLLGLHPDIERAHYKLWLTSRAVLDRVLHNAETVQSDLEVEIVYEQIRRFVPNAAYPRVLEILKRNHVVIISGQPGVGKTTLAKMLLYQHLEEGFEAVSILSDFQSGRKLYQKGKKQIFYFDDFMGTTFLGERGTSFTRNEDRAILDFVKLVSDSPTARLILTTREHILQQAIVISEKMQHSNIIDHRCVLEISDYSINEKAKILYNHICFSDLPLEYQQELIKDDFYLKIIQHDKFNPRLIEWLSNYRRVQSVDLQNYQTFVRDLLHNPTEIWRFAYEEQISNAGRSLLLALYSLGGNSSHIILEKSFRMLHAYRAKKYNFSSRPEDMHRAFSELKGSFIRPSGSGVEVINPSVLDMLNSTMQTYPENAIDIIFSAIRFDQLNRIWRLANAEGNGTVLKVLVDEADQLTNQIKQLLQAPHKRDYGNGSVSYFDGSLEKRLTTLIAMANKMRSRALQALIPPFAEKVISSWNNDRVNIDDTVILIKMVRDKLGRKKLGKSLLSRLLEGLIQDVAHGCQSNELCEVIWLLDGYDLNR